MERRLSERVAYHWLETIHAVPTRSLQLSFETAAANYEQLTDFSIVLAILRNNPSIVPQELINRISQMSEYIKSERAHISAKNAEKRKNPYSATIDPFRPILDKYYAEKLQGIHQYNSGQDYSVDLVSEWLATRRKGVKEDIFVFGHADYLRIAARAIQNLPNKKWQSGSGIFLPSMVASLGRQKGFNKKSTAKLLKKLSRHSHLSQSIVPEHQDIVLFLSGNSIRVRPASFVQEAILNISKSGSSVFASAHNLLSQESPVHVGDDPLSEFEDLLNSKVTTENDFQRFFEKYPRFILGTDYSKLISQPILVREDENNLIPDFILVPHSFAKPTILDLKLPSVSLARHRQNRQGFLQSVMSARDQLLEYRNYFSSKSVAERARVEYGCDLYLPKIAVVIGRSASFTDDYERRKIESRVSDIEVITYDDIYARAVQCREIGLI